MFGNVERVFSRFVNEGKVTIRFIDPPHDLKIQAKVELLKQFLKIFRNAVEGKTIATSSIFSAPTHVPPKEKTKLVISSQRDIPRLTGYPKGLKNLQVN